MTADITNQRTKTSKPIIQGRDIQRAFVVGEQNLHVLKGIDIVIPEGQFCAIMGPSGSGKSTLMYCLGGLDTTNSGQVLVDKRRLDTMTRDELAEFRRTTIGFIFQQYHLVPTMTALENVGLPGVFAGMERDERHQRADRLLKIVGMGDRTDHLPRQLSGGQQQRVAIARALFNDPPIIMGDEPTGALDSKTGKIVMKLLRTLCDQRGKTIIIVTHDSSVAAYADRLVNLRDGVVVEDKLFNHSQRQTPIESGQK
jgi:ABC-type lipoprotein export system ATPase subunit